MHVPPLDRAPERVRDRDGNVRLDAPPLYVGLHRHRDGYPLHTHSFVEVAFVVGGTGNHVCGAVATPLRVGDVLVLEPGRAHGYSDCDELAVLNCCFTEPFFDAILASLGSEAVPRPGGGRLVHGRFAAEDAAQLTSHIAQVLGLLSAQPASPPAILAEVVHLLAQLPSANPVVAAGRRAPARSVSIACARLIDASLDEPITLDQLAHELHITKHHLVRTFTADFGVPPLTYLAARRLDVAAHLVATTDRGIADIASAVGLTDANYFSRRFKQRFGLTPSAYRAAQVAGPILPRSGRRTASRAAEA